MIPVFVGIFNSIAEEHPGEEASLPLPTQICVGASDAITGYWFIVFPVMVVLVVLFFRWKRTDAR